MTVHRGAKTPRMRWWMLTPRSQERERSVWEAERQEYRAKLAFYEGERRAWMAMQKDLQKRIRMLEQALMRERARSGGIALDETHPLLELPPVDPLPKQMQTAKTVLAECLKELEATQAFVQAHAWCFGAVAPSHRESAPAAKTDAAASRVSSGDDDEEKAALDALCDLDAVCDGHETESPRLDTEETMVFEHAVGEDHMRAPARALMCSGQRIQVQKSSFQDDEALAKGTGRDRTSEPRGISAFGYANLDPFATRIGVFVSRRKGAENGIAHGHDEPTSDDVLGDLADLTLAAEESIEVCLLLYNRGLWFKRRADI